MTSSFRKATLSPKALRNFAAARARDLAFDAVIDLWRRRRASGLKHVDLAKRLGRDPGWVSKALRGPGNWTIQTFGELVAAMDGEMEISVFGLEDAPSQPSNYDAYVDFDEPTEPPLPLVRSVLNAQSIYSANNAIDTWTRGDFARVNMAASDSYATRPKTSNLESREHGFTEN
jgi:hypothetical protein